MLAAHITLFYNASGYNIFDGRHIGMKIKWLYFTISCANDDNFIWQWIPLGVSTPSGAGRKSEFLLSYILILAPHECFSYMSPEFENLTLQSLIVQSFLVIVTKIDFKIIHIIMTDTVRWMINDCLCLTTLIFFYSVSRQNN